MKDVEPKCVCFPFSTSSDTIMRIEVGTMCLVVETPDIFGVLKCVLEDH